MNAAQRLLVLTGSYDFSVFAEPNIVVRQDGLVTCHAILLKSGYMVSRLFDASASPGGKPLAASCRTAG
jgi:hypothetical protein